MTVALPIILGAAMCALLLGLAARRGHDMDLEQWSVGGRSFGTLFVFLLLAGEIYTTFSFLGASGFVYGKGAAAYYILGYLTLNQVIGYWLLPQVWRTAKREHLVSQPQFFVRQYRSPALGILVAIVGVAAMICTSCCNSPVSASLSRLPPMAPCRAPRRSGWAPPSSPPMW